MNPFTIIWDSFSPRPHAIIALTAPADPQVGMRRLISMSGSQTYVSISAETAKQFSLEPLRRPGASGPRPLYQSVDAREGITTGISASDRARVLEVLSSPTSDMRDLVRPGHIFPCLVHAGGVLANAALPEAAFDLGLRNGMRAIAFHDLLDPAGGVLPREALETLSKQHQIPLVSLGDVVIRRLTHESLVTEAADAEIPVDDGQRMRLFVFVSPVLPGEHLALVKGTVDSERPLPVRVQVEEALQDLFGGRHGAGRQKFLRSLDILKGSPCGVIVYIRKAPSSDAPSGSPMREYGIGAQILKQLGVERIQLLSSRHRMNYEGLETFGLVVDSVRCIDE